MQTNTFELRLTFSGLCMFVPAKDASAMHVLMPGTGGSTGHPQHLMRLMFHPAHATGTGNPTTPQLPTQIDIAGQVIALAKAGALNTARPAGIVNVSTICG